MFQTRRTSGFTLMELLVAVAIVGILAAVVMVSVNGARVKARDAQRKSDLQQIILVLRMYKDGEGTYLLPGTGYNGGGQGWFSIENGSNYPKSMARALQEEGLLPAVIHDPLVPPNSHIYNGYRPYMVYAVAGGFTQGICALAQLENPTPDDIATITNSDLSPSRKAEVQDNYSMNYAVCN